MGDKNATIDDKQKRYGLCQQWRMAEAAKAEAANSDAQFRIAIGNLVLLFIATIAAVGAAVYARKAAKAGNKTVVAAHDANRIAHQDYIVRHRPHLTVTNVVVDPIPEPGEIQEFSVRTFLCNVGGSEALIKSSTCMLFWHDGALPMWRPYEKFHGEDGMFVENSFAKGRKTLQSGDKEAWPFTAPIRAGVDRKPLERLPVFGDLYIIGWINFANTFDRNYTMSFCRRWCSAEQRFVQVDNPDYEHDR